MFPSELKYMGLEIIRNKNTFLGYHLKMSFNFAKLGQIGDQISHITIEMVLTAMRVYL